MTISLTILWCRNLVYVIRFVTDYIYKKASLKAIKFPEKSGSETKTPRGQLFCALCWSCKDVQ